MGVSFIFQTLPAICNIVDSNDKFPVRRILCVGANYVAHAIEMGRDPTREPPFFFAKPSDAIVNADKEAEAKDAGADFVGKDEFLDKIKAGWTDVDKIVVTPDLMVELGKLGKVLGPKGLMPNPKSGTVTNDVAKAIKELKAGKLDARVEKNGILQSSIGKTSFTEEQLKENFNTLQGAVMSAKPNSFKGKYLKSISISSTLGPGIKIGTE